MYREMYYRYRWYILLTVPMSIILGASSIGVIAVISDAISGDQGQKDFGLSAFVGIVCVLFVAGMINDLLRAKLSSSVIYDIQLHMIKRVMSTPLVRLEKIGFHRVVAMLTEDVEQAIKYFHLLPLMIINLAICVCGIIYMAYLSPQLLLFVLSLITLGVVTISILILSTKRDRIGIRDLTDELIEAYQQMVYGSKELMLSSHRRECFRTGIFSVAGGMRTRSRRVLNILALVEQWGQLLVFSLIGCIVFVVGQYIQVSNEVILGFVITLLFLLDPIETITTCADSMVEARVAFDKIESLELSDYEPVQAVDAKTSDPEAAFSPMALQSYQKLEAREAEFRYESDVGENQQSFAFGPVTASFKCGEISLVIGGNGSGKSTLLKLLCGLYPLSAGEVLLDGKPLYQTGEQPNSNNLFSMVSPDFCLFRDLLDSAGRVSSDESVHEILELLQLDHLVDVNDGKLSTLEYSHGQRKRLALLQVYLEDRPIILLDEWASDQDPVFKDTFYTDLLPDLKRRGKIVIVISHDQRYFECADNVLTIDDGQLVVKQATFA